jgi:hypothetical protein
MNSQQKTRLWARIMCWILAGLMILGGATYVLYAIAGVL